LATARTLKVLHVIPSLSMVHGGPSRAIVLIEQSLKDRGATVETATTDDDGPGRHLDRALGQPVEEGGAIRHYFRKTFDRYKVSTSMARWLFGHVRDYDIVHIHALFSFSSTAAAWAARRAGVPYIIRPLGTLANYGMTRRRPWLKSLSLALLERPMLRHAAAVHFTSDAERAEAAALGVSMRDAVIPLAVERTAPADVELLFASFPQLRDKHSVLYLSRLDPKKNVEGLLRAIAVCAVDLPEIRWVVAGAGDRLHVEHLHGLARHLGIEDRIVWTGQIEGELKAAAFAHAELFVLPSFSENFGIAAAEALQAGLPVILGKGVALSDLATECGAGIAVDPDPDAIAAGIRSYLLDPSARARAGTNAKACAAREFSMETMGARLVGLYETILAAPDKKWPGAAAND
jgi:glycosyltransferase involved in cell wall biosynthesis